MKTRFVCSGCGWEAPSSTAYPFRCARAGDDADHVLVRHLDPGTLAEVRDEPEPFLRFQTAFHAYHAAPQLYEVTVRQLDAAVADVEGHGFVETPLRPQPALAQGLGLQGQLWVKDETSNVSGSHKARHLMGVMIWLQTARKLGLIQSHESPALAIASCGNAALAAAVVARAADYELRVFIPLDADANVVRRLEALEARVQVCPRGGGFGDPCYHLFREAVAAGAVPFGCQGNENGMAIEGGLTLGYEIARGIEGVDHVVVQVGGGALGSSVLQGLREAHQAGWLRRLPRFHTVQTQGANPLRRAWERVVTRSGEVGREEALRYAASHRSEFMWPWETEPHSLATGILDDETYDWWALVRGMIDTDGEAAVATEEDLRAAYELAHTHTEIPVSATGSAGLAGCRVLLREGVIQPKDSVLVLFTGVDR